tara:strand:+ start:392 stop:589 length:198 start_codon:yes stop_codon:yes gene_type:complete
MNENMLQDRVDQLSSDLNLAHKQKVLIASKLEEIIAEVDGLTLISCHVLENHIERLKTLKSTISN